MPFTFLAHQAPVVPLKLRWPHLVSGTGLVLGSMSPDFGYFLIGASVTRDWHRPHGVLLYCLPLSFVLYLLITRVFAAPVARHVPQLGALRLRDWAYLEAQPRTLRHLAVVATSIVFGAATHLAWDLFTHGGSWMGEYIEWLAVPALYIRGRGIVGTSVLWVFSTVVGGTVTLLAIRAIGRRRLLAQWAERRLPGSTAGIDPDGPPATSHLAFWGPVVLVVALVAPATLVRLPPGFHWYDKATWVIVFLRTTSLAIVVLAGVAWRERRAWRHRSGSAADRRAVDSAA